MTRYVYDSSEGDEDQKDLLEVGLDYVSRSPVRIPVAGREAARVVLSGAAADDPREG